MTATLRHQTLSWRGCFRPSAYMCEQHSCPSIHQIVEIQFSIVKTSARGDSIWLWSVVPSDLSGNMSPRNLQIRLLERLPLLKKCREWNDRSKRRYKYEYKDGVCKTPGFSSKDPKFVDKSPLAMKADGASKMDIMTYNKLMSRSNRAIRINIKQQHILTICEEEIPNMVSIDLSTCASRNDTTPQKSNKKEVQQPGRFKTPNVLNGDKDEQKTTKAEAIDTKETFEPDIEKLDVSEDAKDTMDNAVHWIFRHNTKNEKTQYCVRCCEYIHLRRNA